MNDDELSMLRIELSNICEMTNDNEIRNELEQLKQRYDHKINLIRSSKELPECTCFEYALDLHNSQEYMRKRKVLNDAGFGCVLGSSFMQWLLNKGLLNKGNEIILYFKSLNLNEHILKHAGIIKNGGIISKWGTGNVYGHDVFETPKEYGKRRWLYQKLEKIKLEQYFTEYLNELASLIGELDIKPQ